MRRRRRRSARFVPMYPQVLLAAAGALAKMTTTTNTTTTRRGQPPKREDSTGFGSPFLFQRQLHDDAHLLLRCSTQRDSTPRSGAVEPVEPTEPDRALTKLSQPPRRRVVMGGGVPTTTTTTTLMTTICGQRSARSISSVWRQLIAPPTSRVRACDVAKIVEHFRTWFGFFLFVSADVNSVLAFNLLRREARWKYSWKYLHYTSLCRTTRDRQWSSAVFAQSTVLINGWLAHTTRTDILFQCS